MLLVEAFKKRMNDYDPRNQINDVDITLLLDCIDKAAAQKLTEVDLRGSKVSDVGVAALAAGCRDFKYLCDQLP